MLRFHLTTLHVQANIIAILMTADYILLITSLVQMMGVQIAPDTTLFTLSRENLVKSLLLVGAGMKKGQRLLLKQIPR